MRAVLIICAIVAAVSAQQFKYTDYKVYRLHPSNAEQIQFLAEVSKNERLDFWSPIAHGGKPIDVMVEPREQNGFEWALDKKDIKYEILIEDYEQVAQRERLQQRIAPRTPEGRISFSKFNRHGEINAYLNQLAKDHPDIVSLETMGKSHEGRDMNVIKISKNNGNSKRAIFIDAGIHAREWASPAQATYIINQLVENPENSHLLDDIDYHILPVLNPDGYEYSHTNQRLWRKTRSLRNGCYGTDANRNFGFHWGENGASSSPCSDIYKGPSAFSEIESQNVRDYILKYKDNIKLYLTFHSYGQYLLYPWGYTSALPDNAAELQSLGEKVAQAIYNVNGAEYTIGSSTNVLYAAAGGSDDWSKGVGGIELAYTIELPGGGNWGFDLPPSRILPVVKETWEGCKVYFNYIKEKY